VVAGCQPGATDPEPTTSPDVILVDAHHENFHRIAAAYAQLNLLLKEQGWTVRESDAPFSADALADAAALIVPNALAAANLDDWSEPIEPAFTVAEVEAVRAWVEGGGGLLLVADHMPFPKAAAGLAGAFGVEMLNGFAFDTTQYHVPRTCLAPDEIHVFRRSDGTLADHFITNGRGPDERVDSVATFTGQAFDGAGAMQPLMRFGPNAISIQPREAWVFYRDTTVLPVDGWRQGGVLEYGAGRVAILGEAAMFTSQTCASHGGEVPMGWAAPAAAANRQLAVNLVRWLLGEG
jgi:hypothetical protein